MSTTHPASAEKPTVGPRILGGTPTAPIPPSRPRRQAGVNQRAVVTVHREHEDDFSIVRTSVKSGGVMQTLPLDRAAAETLVRDLLEALEETD